MEVTIDKRVNRSNHVEKKWLWAYLLHNLTCKKPFESDFLAIVPHSDSRVQEIALRSHLYRCLIDNFTDQMGSKRYPSILLVREDAPQAVRQIDAVVSFRNLVALSCVIYGRQQSIAGPNVWGTLYTDYFDFYPTTVSEDGTSARTLSPAWDSFGYPREIRGQTSPGLPSTESLGSIEADEQLLQFLMEAWADLYAGSKRFESEGTALFRSLQVAYLAAAMPISNERSIHDYGTKVALWVSAFEILAHPAARGGTGKADFERVKDLLEKKSWSKNELRECKYSVTFRGKTFNVNLIVSLYWDLYRARNDFLHGNPVSFDSLFPFNDVSRPPLPGFAPLIYKAALMGYLQQLGFQLEEPEPDMLTMPLPNPAFDRAVARALKRMPFERAILTAIQHPT